MIRKTAKEILSDSFRELAEGKNIDKITVREIAENCGYSPATFYRNFRDKYDLIAWDYTRKLDAIMSRFGENEHSWMKTLGDAAAHFCDERDYLANLFLHTTGFDSFMTYMQEINFESMKKAVQRVSGLKTLDHGTELLIRVYVLGTVQFTCGWILGDYAATTEELIAVYDQTLPAPLRPYVL